MSNGKPTLDDILTSFGHASKCVLTASQQVLAAVSDDGRDAGIAALELALRQEQYHRDAILALLDRRVMPAPDEVPERVIVEMLDAFARKPSNRDAMRAAYRALYDHYHQPPKPKKVEGWHIAYTDGTSEFSTDWGFIEALHGDLSVSRIVHLREVEGDHD